MSTLFYLQLILLLATCSLFPQQSRLSKNVNHISDYLASEHFLQIKSEIGDLHSIDSFYMKAIKLTDYDYAEAFLALTFATVPYNLIPIQVPLLNIRLYYPLISASENVFGRKNENLPRYFFFDSPQNSYGDKDKLAHFFGSAYISYASNIFDLGNPIGYFVEVFEETFKVQSKIDERDLSTNQLGNIFGKFLKKNEKILPSQIIILQIISHFNYNL